MEKIQQQIMVIRLALLCDRECLNFRVPLFDLLIARANIGQWYL